MSEYFWQYSSCFYVLLFPVLGWNVTLMCRVLFFSSSLCDFPYFQCFSIPFPHLSFSCLTPPSPHPLISVSQNSLCSPSCLCQLVPYSPVTPPFVSHPCRPPCLPVVCFCFYFCFLSFHLICTLLLFCTLLNPFFVTTCLLFLRYIFVCFSWICLIQLLLIKPAFCPPILPPMCCLHLGPHLVFQSVTI